MTSWSGISPDVQRPERDALVVSAICCVSRAVATDSVNTAIPREMSAQFGSFRRAIRKTDATAYAISTSPSQSKKWRDADQEQQRVSPQVQQDCASSFPADAVDEENHARAEQQRKQSYELLVDEDFAEDAYSPVKPRLRAARAQVEIGPVAELEGNGVHQQNAEHRNPAYQVEAGYPPGLANGAGISGLGMCRHQVVFLERT